MTVLEPQLNEAASIASLDFRKRHIGLSQKHQDQLLKALGQCDLDEFVSAVVPPDILDERPPKDFHLHGCTEVQAIEELKKKQSRSSRLIGIDLGTKRIGIHFQGNRRA